MQSYLAPFLLLAAFFSSSSLFVRGTNSNSDDHSIKRFRRELKRQQQLSDAWLEQHANITLLELLNVACPCPDPTYCYPIPASSSSSDVNNNHNLPFQPSGEVYGFAGASDTGEKFNWTHITTVAWASNDTLMCQAHQHGSRAVIGPPSFNLTLMTLLNDKDRNQYIQTWTESALKIVQGRHRDGVVFDFEGPMARNSPIGQAYVALINATRTAFHSATDSDGFTIPPMQVSTCVAWSPDGIDGRYFPHEQLAEASDLLYVMDYDTQSQIIQGPCLASANAPITGTRQGIQQFLELGISPSKLILGVPWYGYTYPCLPGTRANDRFCQLPLVPFRGVDCSDAAGYEVPYSNLLHEFQNQSTSSARETLMRRDAYMDAAFFNSQVKNQVVKQSWLDDPISLRHKYAYARSVGLAGVGPFQFSDLDPVLQPEESRQMWSAFDTFWEEAGVDNDDDATETQ